MNWTLELIVVPVSDIDRSKAFYADQLGFSMDVDHSAGDDFRVVQLSPPGSACSIALMKNQPTPPGGLHGLQVCVEDIEVARRQLIDHAVEASDFFYFDDAGQHAGLDPERRSYATFLSFHDPDGNTWLVQEKKPVDAAA